MLVDMKNPSANLPFLVRTKIPDKSGKLIRPVICSDYYLSLARGESKVTTIKVPGDIKNLADAFLEVWRWNLQPVKYYFSN